MFERFGLIESARHSKVEAFVEGLERGELLATRCRDCGHQSFPPRADCERCRSERFEWVSISGRGTVSSHTTIHAAPTGFEELAPYSLVLVELAAGGRILALTEGEGPPPAIGAEVDVVPRSFESAEGERVGYVATLPSPTEGRA